MLNIQFQGNLFDSNSLQFVADEVAYQIYFYKVNPSSSDSKWGSVHQSEFGQYSFNLGDIDLLTQSGNASAGDRILILCWTPNSSQRQDLNLTQWGFIGITLTSSQIYTTNVQIKAPFNPILSASIIGTLRVQEASGLRDTGCSDSHSWVFQGNTHFQIASLYSQNLFLLNQLENDSLSIDWDDGSPVETFDPGLDMNHIFDHSATFNVSLTVTNRSGLITNQSFDLSIRWRVPTVNFSISNSNPNPQGETGLGQNVVFINTSTNPDGRASIDNWRIAWILNDTGTHGNHTINLPSEDFNYSPNHSWYNVGPFDASMTLSWYDGFDWLTIPLAKSITQHIWAVVNGLTWATPQILIPTLFTPHITGDVFHIHGVDYEIDSVLEFHDLLPTDTFEFTFTTADVHHVNQIIKYHDGFDSQTQSLIFDVSMESQVLYEYHNFGCGLEFVDISTIGKLPILSRLWEVRRVSDNSLLASLSDLININFIYSWPETGSFRVKLIIEDSESTLLEYSEVFTVVLCSEIEREIDITDIEYTSDVLNIKPLEIVFKQGEGRWISFIIKNDETLVNVTGASFSFVVKKDPQDEDYLIEKINSDFDVAEASQGIVKVNISDTDIEDLIGSYLGELKIIFVANTNIEKSKYFSFVVRRSLFNS